MALLSPPIQPPSGGNAFNKGSADAQATALKNQGQQLLGAAELYYLEKQQWPQTPQALVDGGFLKAVPVAGTAVSAAQAAVGWTMPSPGVPVFAYANVAPEVCRQVNVKAYGLAGVLSQFHTQFLQQCAGAELNSLTVVTARNGAHLQEAAGDLSVPVVTSAIPDPEDTAAWLVLPSAGVVASPGQSAGGDGAGSGSGSGTGTTVKGVLTFSAEPLLFGSLATNTSATQTFTLSNSGPGEVVFQGVPVLSGSSSYSIVQSTCTTLAVDTSCAVTVQFAPTVVGEAQTATLTWNSSAENAAGSAVFEGAAYNPLALSPATLPTGRVGTAYGPYNFGPRLSASNEQAVDLAQVTWAASLGLPTGMQFSNGVLSGTPTTATADAPIEVTATYKGNQISREYLLTVLALGNYSKLSMGTFFACGITGDGGVACWGSQDKGRQGDGVSVPSGYSLTPTRLAALSSGVTDISAGGSGACAVMNGQVYCWGQNTSGFLGVGAANSAVYLPTSTGLSGATSVRVANTHACALTGTGSVYCWGNNAAGQVGDGTQANRVSPTPVALPSAAISVATADASACAALQTGSVYCWGSGFTPLPQLQAGLSGIVGLAGVSQGKASSYCGQQTGGTVVCWNSAGLRPSSGVTGVAEVSVGNTSTCVRKGDGTVQCWTTDSNSPAVITVTVEGATSITSGRDGACAVLQSGAGRCWGGNGYGQLGDGTRTTKPEATPATVISPTP